MTTLTVSEIAARLGGFYEGSGECPIHGIAGIRDAGPGEITFVSNPRYAADVAATQASAVIVPQAWDRGVPSNMIRVADADKAFAQVVEWFMRPMPRPAPGVHPSAVVASSAAVGAGVHVGPNAVIGEQAKIGARTVISAGCVVGAEVQIGEDCLLYPLSSIRERCHLGNRVILHNGSVIGSDGFGYSVDAKGVRTKIPQLGIVWIDDDVEIGANTTVDRARFGKTVIGKGVKIDNLAQIAHNVVIGEHAVIVAQCGISGSTSIGARAVLAGQSGIVGHIRIGEGAVIAAQSGVSNDVEPGAYMLGSPAKPAEQMARIYAVIQKLPEIKKRLAELEKRIAATDVARPAVPGPATPRG